MQRLQAYKYELMPIPYGLKENPSQTLQQTLKDLVGAYQKFFEKKASYHAFKKRGHYDAFRFPGRGLLVCGH